MNSKQYNLSNNQSKGTSHNKWINKYQISKLPTSKQNAFANTLAILMHSSEKV